METRRDVTKTMGKAFAQVEISSQSFAAAEQFLTQMEFELRTKVVEKAIKAAAAPVVKQAKKFAPDSVKSGTRELWSLKVRWARNNTPQHKTTIGVSSVRSYNSGTMAIYVGPLYPGGNLINVIGHPHQQMLWGRASGRVIPGTDYLHRAAESTEGEQQAAFVNKVQSETAKILNKGSK